MARNFAFRIMIDIWQKRAVYGVHLSQVLPAGGQGRSGPVPAQAGVMQLMHALALGFLGTPDAPPLVSVLEPGEFRWIHRVEPGALERAIRRRAGSAIGWMGPLRRYRLCLVLLLARAAGQRGGDGGCDQHAGPWARSGRSREG